MPNFFGSVCTILPMCGLGAKMGHNFGKNLAEMGSKNPALLVSQEFSPLTAAKRIMEKY